MTPNFEPFQTDYAVEYDPNTVTRLGEIVATKTVDTDYIGSIGQGAQTPVDFCGYREVGASTWQTIQKAEPADTNPETGFATFALQGKSWELQIVLRRRGEAESKTYTVLVTPE